MASLLRYKRGVRVRPYPHRPTTPWVVDVPAKLTGTGKRTRKYFLTEEAGAAWIDAHVKESAHFGTLFSHLSGDTRMRLARCLDRAGSIDKLEEILNGAGTSARSARLTIAKAVDAFTRDKELEGVARSQWKKLRSKLGHFVRAFGSRDANSMTTSEITDWLASRGFSTGMKQTVHQVLRSFFRWLRRSKKVISVDPMEDVARPRFRRGEKNKAEILTVDEMRMLLEKADGPMLLHFVLGGLVGLRTEEMTGNMDHRGIYAEEIDLKKKELLVSAEVTKTREWMVPLHSTAIAWLKRCQLPEKGRLFPWRGRHFQDKRLAFAQSVGLAWERWPHNALRHSFASYDLAAFEDVARTAFRMRHTDAQVTLQHYRRLVTKQDGLAWWALTPKRVLKK